MMMTSSPLPPLPPPTRRRRCPPASHPRPHHGWCGVPRRRHGAHTRRAWRDRKPRSHVARG